MEKIKKQELRKVFICYVAAAFFCVALLSVLTVRACFAVRARLLPAGDEVWLNVETLDSRGQKATQSLRVRLGAEPVEIPKIIASADGEDFSFEGEPKYSVTSIGKSFTALSPKRQLLYHACGVGMILLPLLFSVTGILVCGLLFFDRRLKKPIDLLAAATEKIGAQDLDFKLESPSRDELGLLCASFEQMRSALEENNRRMWGMLEERRQLQASVAHDLRNPIAIIESHAEYLRINLSTGGLPNEKILSILCNIEKASKRLERYTDSIRAINHLEELEIERQPVDFAEICRDMEEDFAHMAASRGLAFRLENTVAEQELVLDPQVLYRILENLVGNAVRYAKSRICISFLYEKPQLQICVTDDGPGFSEKMLSAKNEWFLSESEGGEHSGIGLTISRILCKKHGGGLVLGNSADGGAEVTFMISVQP